MWIEIKPNSLYYALREIFSPLYEDGSSWITYKQLNNLQHLEEVVSLDQLLNNDVIDTDSFSDNEWQHVVYEDKLVLPFYTDFDFVFKKVPFREKYNLLAIIFEPDKDCRQIEMVDFDFVGYELLDLDYNNSALTNCGGFDETFLPEELNEFGLISDFNRVREIQVRLPENNPDEFHAETNLIAIWRHKTLGK